MKIAVTGPNGQLGSELVKQGCIPLTGRFYSNDLKAQISEYRPDAIINCAALTYVDGCEYDVAKSVAVNTRGVEYLSTLFDGYLIQISTDYIFDGVAGPYGPKDPPNPLSIYGWSKLGGELLTRQHKAPWLIIRTTILFSQMLSNFVASVVLRLGQGSQVTLYEPDLRGTPTYVPYLGEEIIRQVKAEYTGVSHIAGRKVMTRFDFARLIAHTFGFNPDDILTTDDKLVGAPRPLRAGLICDNSNYRPVRSHSAAEGLAELARRYERGEIWK